MMMLRNQRKSKNLLGLIFFLAIGVALIIGLPQKAVATNMDLGFDDKLWDERHTSDVKYYVKFPQYFEVPYQVTDINIVATYNNSYQVMIFPDNGAGLPDTTDVLLTAGYSWMEGDKPEGFYGIQWLPFTVNGNGIIESPGPVWLEFRFPPDVTRLFGVDTNSPDGRSYYYDGDYHQYLDGDYMMRIVEEGVALEHDVLVKEVDIPHRYTVPAEHTIIPRIFIENAGQNIETFGVTCAIDSSGCNIYTSTFPFPVTLEPQSTTPITFAPWDVGGENNVYDITFYTQLGIDEFPSNDTINITVTASFIDTLRYDLKMLIAASATTAGQDNIVRITPQAYPCKLMEVQPWFWSPLTNLNILVSVMEDANPDNLDTFEPGDIIWSGWCTAIAGQDFQYFDLSEENIIIYESDVEAYVGVHYPPGEYYAWDNPDASYNPANRFNTWQNYDGNCNYVMPVVVSYLPQVGVEETAGQIPEFSLSQNYPNPFSTSTTISFNIHRRDAKDAEIKIYNVKSQLVKQLSIFNSQSSIEWDGKDENGKQLSSGIYFYRLTAGDFTDTKKCVILR